MNSKNNTTSTPNTIQNYDNYLKDYINTSGFQWNSQCLVVAFKNLGNNFEKYIQKIGDYNTIAATNPQYTQSRSYQEKDYSQSCPEGWTFKGSQGGCINPFYNAKPYGTTDCPAGRSQYITKKEMESCPTGPYRYGYGLLGRNGNWGGPIDASVLKEISWQGEYLLSQTFQHTENEQMRRNVYKILYDNFQKFLEEFTKEPVETKEPDQFKEAKKGYNAPRTGKMKKRWSTKYKGSINCSNPKGFSQKQYCKRKRSGGKYKTEG